MPNAVPYYQLMCLGSLLYPTSIYLYKKKCYWWSTYVHCMVHIVANISNAVLYGDWGGGDGGDGGDAGDIGVCRPP